uniref:Uncharacterized protein n=1 Tax=Oryza nivara TaxID=4536 RepID=A0A0E0HB45_ORYNI
MEAAPARESVGIEEAVVGATRVAEDDGSGARMEAAPVGAVRAAEAGGSERASDDEQQRGGGLGSRRRQRRQRTTTPPPSYPYVLSLSVHDTRLRAGGHDEALPRWPLYHLVSHLTGAAAPFTPLPLIPSSLSSALKRAWRQGDRNQRWMPAATSGRLRRRSPSCRHATASSSLVFPSARPQADLVATEIGAGGRGGGNQHWGKAWGPQLASQFGWPSLASGR